ncbi:acyltransferase [Vibrio vulnificus]|nr:acyltransferase [Vibrio vulnificus]
MKSFKLYLWEIIFSRIPINITRLIVFKYFMGNLIGNSSILRNLELTCIGGVEVGSNTTINKNCYLDGRGRIRIGSHVSISPRVRIITASHDINSKDFSLVTDAVMLEDYVWVCSDVTILPGVTIGKGAVVAACSVVTKDVPAYSVVAGNPAKVIGTRNKDLVYNPLWRPRFQ